MSKRTGLIVNGGFTLFNAALAAICFAAGSPGIGVWSLFCAAFFGWATYSIWKMPTV